MEIYTWLAILVVSLVVEALTATLTAVWFVPSAAICMILAAFSVPVYVQICVFIIASGLFMLLFYKKLRDHIFKKSEKTNLDAVISSEAIVEEDIFPHKTGRVKIGGISWSAIISNNSEPLYKDEICKVIRIEGVKVLVEKLEIKEDVKEEIKK